MKFCGQSSSMAKRKKARITSPLGRDRLRLRLCAGTVLGILGNYIVDIKGLYKKLADIFRTRKIMHCGYFSKPNLFLFNVL